MTPQSSDGTRLDRDVSHRGRNALAMAIVGVAWLVVDVVTKRFFDGGAFEVGEHVAGPFFGLFRFTLVHNTGGAWGIFADSTTVLGVVALLVSVALVVFVIGDRRASLGQAVGAALVAAGGIGNALDRFLQGYVVDFIDFAFMDFPVFNVADIGVTCGLVLLIAATLLAWRREDA